MAETEYHLAELNIARLAAPLDSVQLADFVAGLEPVNALADASPGFVWRLKDEAEAEGDGEGGGNATSFVLYDEPMILVNMSVWTSRQALSDFVYHEAHAAFLRRRREFFERIQEAYTVLWWVPAGHRPTLAEARERLDHLRAHGPSACAFRLRDETYPAPIAPAEVSVAK